MKLVDEFESAVRAHEMKGAAHPADFEAIELNYILTKKLLIDAIKQLKAKSNRSEQMK